jgi:hypothetical protein
VHEDLLTENSPSKKAQAEPFRLRHNAWSTPAGQPADQGTYATLHENDFTALRGSRFLIEFGDDLACSAMYIP